MIGGENVLPKSPDNVKWVSIVLSTKLPDVYATTTLPALLIAIDEQMISGTLADTTSGADQDSPKSDDVDTSALRSNTLPRVHKATKFPFVSVTSVEVQVLVGSPEMLTGTEKVLPPSVERVRNTCSLPNGHRDCTTWL